MTSADHRERARRAARVPSARVIGDELRAADVGDVALHLFDELPSTNRWLEARLAEAGESRALCAADLQSAGLARRGRTWVSVAGNVALSTLERMPVAPARLTGLGLVTGIAVATVLRESGVPAVNIKWPNDILLDGAKLGGLLGSMQPCPHVSGHDACTAVVSGIGLNVVHDERVAALGIGGTSLQAAGWRTLERDVLLGRIAARVFALHARFLEEGWPAFAEAWCTFDALAGREIDIVGERGAERARALGVDGNGALRVRVGSVERVLYGGEVTVRPTG